MQVNDIFTLLSMVNSGVGYALLPGRVGMVYESRVRLIPLQARYHLQQHIGVVFLKARSATRTCWRCSPNAGCMPGAHLEQNEDAKSETT